MGSVRLLAFAGSLRAGSWNKNLINVACDTAEAAGCEVTRIELNDYTLPIYDGDIEAGDGIPENALTLKQMFLDHHGLLISTPEYNNSISAVLKNTIDWVSRPHEDNPAQHWFRGKVVGLMAASPGARGGISGLHTTRQILSVLGAIVVPTQYGVGGAHNAFDDDGKITVEAHQNGVSGVVNLVVDMAAKLNA